MRQTRTEHGGDTRIVALYLRPLSDRQLTAAQEADLKRWKALRAGMKGPSPKVRWYRCPLTGRDAGRPGWERLMRDVEAGKVDTIVCWRLDRLGKSCAELIKLFDLLGAQEVNLISLQEPFDLSTPGGRRTVSVLTSVASCESEVRAERIVAGQEAARARGIRWGGSEKGRRLKVTVRLEERIRSLHAAGHKITHIAQRTKLSRPTIYRVLGSKPPPRGK